MIKKTLSILIVLALSVICLLLLQMQKTTQINFIILNSWFITIKITQPRVKSIWAGFNYAARFNNLDMEALKKDIKIY